MTPDPRLKRWSTPDGVLGHDGDCHIYNAFAGICTCGLLHTLNRIGWDKAEEMYSPFEGDMEKHLKGLAIVEDQLREDHA